MERGPNIAASELLAERVRREPVDRIALACNLARGLKAHGS
jgi:hypothetical protein